jgi:hypothetical protein
MVGFMENRRSGGPSASTTHPLPSGRFPLETHFAVLRRFMSVSRNGVEPVAPEAAEGEGVPAGAAQENAAFLSDLGFLIEEKPGQFKPTAVAMQLVNTQLADEQRGRRLLRSIVAKTWFAGSVAAVLRNEPTAPPPEEDLVTALVSAAHLAAGQEEASLRVLLQYLEYTGILQLPERQPVRPASPSGAVAGSAPTAVPLAPARAVPPRGPHPAVSPDESEGWEVIQTSEFSLKIRSSSAAVKRLRKQLDLLEQKLLEQG